MSFRIAIGERNGGTRTCVGGMLHGCEAGALVPRLLRGDVRPVHHAESLPMLLPTSTTSFGCSR